MGRTGIEEVQVLKIQYFMLLAQYSKKNEVLLLPGFKQTVLRTQTATAMIL
jgi:hypothetical protein